MWDDRYSAKDYICGTNPNDFLFEYAYQIPERKFLCANLTKFKIEPDHRDAIILIFCHIPVSLRKTVNKNAG